MSVDGANVNGPPWDEATRDVIAAENGSQHYDRTDRITRTQSPHWSWRNPAERTGRTTRMLNHAVYLAELGYCVYVLSHNTNFAKQINWSMPTGLDIRIELFDRVYPLLDPQTMQFKGNDFLKKRVLIDHYSIESHFEALLNELHRYDDQGHARLTFNFGNRPFQYEPPKSSNKELKHG